MSTGVTLKEFREWVNRIDAPDEAEIFDMHVGATHLHLRYRARVMSDQERIERQWEDVDGTVIISKPIGEVTLKRNKLDVDGWERTDKEIEEFYRERYNWRTCSIDYLRDNFPDKF